MDKVNIVKGWLDFANKDISCAKHLLGMRPVPLEIICYHSEQAAEEAVKGFLIYYNVEPPRTYDLEMLCRMCMDIDNTFDKLIEPCGRLARYGEQIYPLEMQISHNDMRTAIADADHVMEFVLQRLQLAEEISPDDDRQKDQQEKTAGQQLT
jgi:HEPN domain-containing protein